MLLLLLFFLALEAANFLRSGSLLWTLSSSLYLPTLCLTELSGAVFNQLYRWVASRQCPKIQL